MFLRPTLLPGREAAFGKLGARRQAAIVAGQMQGDGREHVIREQLAGFPGLGEGRDQREREMEENLVAIDMRRRCERFDPRRVQLVRELLEHPMRDAEIDRVERLGQITHQRLPKVVNAEPACCRCRFADQHAVRPVIMRTERAQANDRHPGRLDPVWGCQPMIGAVH